MIGLLKGKFILHYLVRIRIAMLVFYADWHLNYYCEMGVLKRFRKELKMGVGFNWFKNYKIIEENFNVGFGENTEYRIKYLDGDYTSHAYGNRTKLQNIFHKYLNIEIPTISGCWSSKPNLNLIEPSILSEYCTKLINDYDNYDLEDMTDRIQWIKDLSDEGYYVSYDVL
jgi:hypothetical protein